MKISSKCFMILLLLVVVSFVKPIKIEANFELSTEKIVLPDTMTINHRWSGDGGTNDVYSAPLIIDLDHDGLPEFLHYSYIPGYPPRELYCLNSNGDLRWSRNVYSNINDPTPTVVDINGDFNLEVLTVDFFTLYCLNSYNGIVWSYDFSSVDEEITSTPLLMKTQPFSNTEIVLFTNESICFFNVNGDLIRKRSLSPISKLFTVSLSSYGDLYVGVDQLTDRIYTYDDLGLLFLGMWFDCRRNTRSPAITDLNDDGDFEYIYQDTNGYIKCSSYAYGDIWSYYTNEWIDGPPAVADLENDGSYEILIKTNQSILCLDESGNLEWNYTRTTNYMTCTSMAIADLDNDATLEIIFSEVMDNNLTCISHNGVKEWSYMAYPDFWASPAIADIDLDGIVEIFIGTSGDLGCFEITDVGQSGNQSWSAYQGSIYHTGNIDSDGDLIDDYHESYGSTNPLIRDTDSDLIPDGYEMLSDILPNYADYDGDGLLDGEELYNYNTLPKDSDTDNDGAYDGEEILTYFTSPFNPDMDGDGSLDGEEIHSGIDGYYSDPFDPDTDNDGLLDGEELVYLSDPNSIDGDNDQLLDYDEVYVYGTDPATDDSENDGIDDYWEIQFGLNPLINDSYIDFDLDGLTALEEYSHNTNPFDFDTDDDLLSDGEEINNYLTDPLLDDSDGDSLKDGQEIFGYYSPSNPGANATGYIHTNPLNPDSDGDSYIDSVEIFSDSDPNDPSSIPVVETPPPITITENFTVTTTVETGAFILTTVITTGIILSIAVIFIKRRRK